MAYVEIPDKHRDALKGLAMLSDEGLLNLVEDLEGSDGKYGSLSDVLDRHVESGENSLRALIALTALSRDSDMPTAELIGYIKSSFEIETESDSLLRLVEAPAVQRSAKALQLRNAYERILLNSQVITDIRPVFADDGPCNSVNAAMVNHVLKLNFRSSDRESEDLYIAVDADDLKKFRNQADRALSKEAASREFIESANAIVLEAKEATE